MRVLKVALVLFAGGVWLQCASRDAAESRLASRAVAEGSVSISGCADDLSFRAKGTGEVYNILGQPVAGGESLRQVAGINMYWFAFSVFYPNAELAFSNELVNAGKSLPSDKTGVLGCGGGKDCIPYLGRGVNPEKGYETRELHWIAGNTKDPAQLEQIDYLLPSDTVMGMFIDNVARAYPRNIFWWHEIANDEINGKKFSVTLCPLTGSSVVFDGSDYTFLVGGNLLNSNLVMADQETGAYWPQLLLGKSSNTGTSGTWLNQIPMIETTWENWKKLHPDTVVLSKNTGFERNYKGFPYGDFQTNNSNTFRRTDPAPDPKYGNKDYVFVLARPQKGAAKGFVSTEIEAQAGGECAVVNETFDEKPVVYIYAKRAAVGLPPQWSVAYERPLDANGIAIEFEIAP